MTETTTESTSLDFELVAQAARLAAPVSSGSARQRRVLPAPPPPPSVRTLASTPLPLVPPARTTSPSDVAALLAWEEAAEQLEPDWATPVDDDDVAEHTAPLVPEPGGEAVKLPLIAIDSSDPKPAAQAQEAGTPDALAIVEVNVATAEPPTTPKAAMPEEKTDAADAASQSSDALLAPLAEATASTEVESELEALARSVTKSAMETLASRGQAPGRPLPAPPVASRAPVPPPPPVASRPPTPPFPPTATRTPLPVPANTRPTLPPLSPPARDRTLAPLTSAPSRPPASSAFRAPTVAPPAPNRAPARSTVTVPRSKLPTLPRMADLEPRPALAAPSLLEIRSSPVARRFYAQLGVAAVFGALLATILFAMIPRQTTSVAMTNSKPAAAETSPAPVAVAKNPEAPAARDTIPPPPVANVSVDDLEREPAAAAKAQPKTAAADLRAAAVPAALEIPVAAPATEPAAAAAPKLEPAAVATKGTLHINAVPPANVAIDGRPLGMTPKIVRLSPGSHRVALIGPGGRRSQTVNVAPGRTATVSVKF